MKKIGYGVLIVLTLSACSGSAAPPLPACSYDVGNIPTPTWSGAGAKIVFTGDSIMHVFNTAMYFPTYQTLNVAVSGQCTTQVNSRFERDVLSNSPDVVVMNGGINDILKGQPSTEYLKDSIIKAKAAGVRVIVVGIYAPGSEISHLTSAIFMWNDDMSTFAADNNIDYIDNTYPGVTSGLVPDGIHLNASGYMTLANKIAYILQSKYEQTEIK